jgi:hypothetical protein
MQTERPPLAALLSEHKSALVAQWLHEMLQSYPESSVNFLSGQRDPFRNPVGHTLKEGLSLLFDRLVQSSDVSDTPPALDGILRIRAVQDISAGQAVAFIFLFKRIVRAEFPMASTRFADELAALEERIDAMTLLAFDLFMKCRERIFEIKANESKRRAFLSERAHLHATANPE